MEETEFHDIADSPLASYERHPVEDMEPVTPDETNKLRPLLFWIAEPMRRTVPVGTGHKSAKPVARYCGSKLGIRSAVLVYCLAPDLFPGETMETLSRKHGFTKQAFSKHVRSFFETFGIQTRVMRSKDARESMRRAAIRSHARRRLASVTDEG